MTRRTLRSTRFPYTTLFRSIPHAVDASMARHIDILPTILEVVGLPAQKNLPGISLLSRLDRAGVSCYFEALSDRKSTRLNSSHTVISYAVFCLKKKLQYCDI